MTNADCTLYKYKDGKYTRYFIPGVYWHESKAANVMKSGIQSADSITVFFFSNKVIPEAPAKDMLVKGCCFFNFTATTEKELSEQMKEFRKKHKFVVVTSVDPMMYGSLPHVEISAK